MDDGLITIATFDYAGSAHILRAKLESEGIEAYIIDENVTTMFWHYNQMTKGAKLQVRQSDASRALQIIGEKSRDLEPTEIDRDELRCPQCGSENIYFEKASRGWAMLGFLLFRFPIPVLKRKWVCSDCRHQWKQK